MSKTDCQKKLKKKDKYTVEILPIGTRPIKELLRELLIQASKKQVDRNK